MPLGSAIDHYTATHFHTLPYTATHTATHTADV